MRTTAKTRRTMNALECWGIKAEEREQGRYDRVVEGAPRLIEHVDEQRPHLRLFSVVPPEDTTQL